MDVTVNMTAEEFLEFMAWKKDRDYYEKELDKETVRDTYIISVLRAVRNGKISGAMAP